MASGEWLMTQIRTLAQLREAYPQMWSAPNAGSDSRVPLAGWFPLIVAMCAEIDLVMRDDPERHGFRIDRLSQKFGTLSVSWIARGLGDAAANQHDTQVLREIYALVLRAQQESERTCEICGAPGHLRRGAPVMTLCDAHADMYALGLLSVGGDRS
jgi:hypothetical protein